MPSLVHSIHCHVHEHTSQKSANSYHVYLLSHCFCCCLVDFTVETVIQQLCGDQNSWCLQGSYPAVETRPSREPSERKVLGPSIYQKLRKWKHTFYLFLGESTYTAMKLTPWSNYLLGQPHPLLHLRRWFSIGMLTQKHLYTICIKLITTKLTQSLFNVLISLLSITGKHNIHSLFTLVQFRVSSEPIVHVFRPWHTCYPDRAIHCLENTQTQEPGLSIVF